MHRATSSSNLSILSDDSATKEDVVVAKEEESKKESSMKMKRTKKNKADFNIESSSEENGPDLPVGTINGSSSSDIVDNTLKTELDLTLLANPVIATTMTEKLVN